MQKQQGIMSKLAGLNKAISGCCLRPLFIHQDFLSIFLKNRFSIPSFSFVSFATVSLRFAAG